MAGADSFFPPKESMPPKGPSAIGCIPLKKRFLWPYKHPLSSQSSEDSADGKPLEDATDPKPSAPPTSAPDLTRSSTPDAGAYALPRPPEPPSGSSILDEPRDNHEVSSASILAPHVRPPVIDTDPMASSAACTSVSQSVFSAPVVVSQPHEGTEIPQRGMPLKYAIKKHLPTTSSFWTSSSTSTSFMTKTAVSSITPQALLDSTGKDPNEAVDGNSDGLAAAQSLYKVCRKKKIYNSTPQVNVNLPPRYVPLVRHMPSPRHVSSTSYLSTKYTPGVGRKRTPQWMPQKLKPPVRHSARLRNKRAAKTFLAKMAAAAAAASPGRDGAPPPARAPPIAAKTPAKSKKADASAPPPKEDVLAKAPSVEKTVIETAGCDDKSQDTEHKLSHLPSPVPEPKVPDTPREEPPALPAPSPVDAPPPTDEADKACTEEREPDHESKTVEDHSVEEAVVSPTPPQEAPPEIKHQDEVIPNEEPRASSEARSLCATPVVEATSSPAPAPKEAPPTEEAVPKSEEETPPESKPPDPTPQEERPPERQKISLKITVRPPKKEKVKRKKKSKSRKGEREAKDHGKKVDALSVVAKSSVSGAEESMAAEIAPAAEVVAPKVEVEEASVKTPKKKGPRVVLYTSRKSGSSQWKCALQTSPLLKKCKDCKVVLDKLPAKLDFFKLGSQMSCTPCKEGKTKSPVIISSDVDSDDPDKLVIDIDGGSKTPKKGVPKDLPKNEVLKTETDASQAEEKEVKQPKAKKKRVSRTKSKSSKINAKALEEIPDLSKIGDVAPAKPTNISVMEELKEESEDAQEMHKTETMVSVDCENAPPKTEDDLIESVVDKEEDVLEVITVDEEREEKPAPRPSLPSKPKASERQSRSKKSKPQTNKRFPHSINIDLTSAKKTTSSRESSPGVVTVEDESSADQPESSPGSCSAKLESPTISTSVKRSVPRVPPSYARVMEADTDNSLNMIQEEFRGMKQGETRVIVITKKQYDGSAAPEGVSAKSEKVQVSSDVMHELADKSGVPKVELIDINAAQALNYSKSSTPNSTLSESPEIKEKPRKTGRFFSDARKRSNSQTSSISQYIKKQVPKKGHSIIESRRKSDASKSPAPSKKSGERKTSIKPSKGSNSWKQAVMNQIKIFSQDQKSINSDSEGESHHGLSDSFSSASRTPDMLSPQSTPCEGTEHSRSSDSFIARSSPLTCVPVSHSGHIPFSSPAAMSSPAITSPARIPARTDTTNSLNYANQVAGWVSDISDDDADHGPKKPQDDGFKIPVCVPSHERLSTAHCSSVTSCLTTMFNGSVSETSLTPSPARDADFRLPPGPLTGSHPRSKKHLKRQPSNSDMRGTPTHLSSSEQSEWECEIISDNSKSEPYMSPYVSPHLPPTPKANSKHKHHSLVGSKHHRHSSVEKTPPTTDLQNAQSTHQKKSRKPPQGERTKSRGKKVRKFKGKFKMEGKDDPTYMPGAPKGQLIIEDDSDVDSDVEEAGPVEAVPDPQKASSLPSLSPASYQQSPYWKPGEFSGKNYEECCRLGKSDDESEQYEVSDEAFNARLYALYRHDRFKTRSSAKMRQIVDFTNVDWLERQQSSKASSISGSEVPEDRDLRSDDPDRLSSASRLRKGKAKRKPKQQRVDSNASTPDSRIKLVIKLPKAKGMDDEMHQLEKVDAVHSGHETDDGPPHLSPIQMLDHHRSHHIHSDCPKLDNVADRLGRHSPEHYYSSKTSTGMLPMDLQSHVEDISSEEENNVTDVQGVPFQGNKYGRKMKELYQQSTKWKRKPTNKHSSRRKRPRHDAESYTNVSHLSDEDSAVQIPSPLELSDSDAGEYYSTSNMKFHRSRHRKRSDESADSSSEEGSFADFEDPELLANDLEELIREAATLSRDFEERLIQDPRSMVTYLDRMVQGSRTLCADIEEQQQRESQTDVACTPTIPINPVGIHLDLSEDDYGGLSPAHPILDSVPVDDTFKTPAAVLPETPGKRSWRSSSRSACLSPRHPRDSMLFLSEDNSMDRLLSQPSNKNFGCSPIHNVFADALSEDVCHVENSIDDIIMGACSGIHRSYEFATLGKYGERHEESMWSNVDSTVDLSW